LDNYKEHDLWLKLEAKRIKKTKEPSVFDGLITEYKYGQTIKVL